MVKNPPANAGNAALIPESKRFPGEGNGKPLQYSCLENSTDSGAWWAIVHEVAKSRTQLSTPARTHTHTHTHTHTAEVRTERKGMGIFPNEEDRSEAVESFTYIEQFF